MNPLAAAAPLTGQPQSEKREYDHGSLKIRENTLVIGNSIYPISNISTIVVTDLRNPIPVIVWVILATGGLFLLMGKMILALPLIALAGYAIYLNWKATSPADYALSVQMNSGNTALVLNNDIDFLKAIALELYEVIELERPSSTTFNIDQKVRINRITGSKVAVTGIQGDIVNNVEAL